MKKIDKIVLEGKHGKPIIGDLRLNESRGPLVIFCHGFKGFKDWGHFNLIADYLCKHVGHVFKFNFSFNGGTIEEVVDFPDLEAFGQNNYIKELDDLQIVIDAFFDGSIQLSNWDEQVFLIGHSRGGGIVTIKAALEKRVSKVVSLAGVGDFFKRLPDTDVLEEWKSSGVYFIKNGRTNQDMPMYYQFVEAMIQHQSLLDIGLACEQIECPQLIVHGTLDSAVSLNNAEYMHERNPDSKLFVLQGGDHTLGGKHPWLKKELPALTERAMQEVVQFYKD